MTLGRPATTRGMNVFTTDQNMRRYLERHYPGIADRYGAMLGSLGAFCGDELEAQAEYSDRHAPPVLQAVPDHPAAPGGRRNSIILNDRYTACQQELYKRGTLAACFGAEDPAPHMLAFLTQYMVSYADISTGCPYAMTHPVALMLAENAPPALRDKFLPQMLRTDGKTPVGGTWATEKHGGSDVARTVTQALPQEGGSVALEGHQWFASATGFERWLTIKTARPAGAPEGAAGLGLYLVPSHLDEDWDRDRLTRPNAVDISGLKSKMGTRGLPTAEVELRGTTAYEIAPPGQGLKAMMSALGVSRVHNAMAAAGVMHRAYREALCWAANREAFGRKIITRPMVQKRLLDIKTEWMAGSALAFEAARSFDAVRRDKAGQDWLRVATALAKYKTAKQAAECAQAALRLGAGNHYTQDFPTERILRDAEVLAVWEGPEEVQALELMRMLLKGNGAKEFLARLDTITGSLPGAAMGKEKMRIRVLRNKAAYELTQLAARPETAEELADEFLETLSVTLAYALLCEEAAFELSAHNDRTKLLASEYYYERHIGKPGPGITHRPPALRSHFEDVAADRPIPPEPVSGPEP